jgi:MFS family permease
MDMGSGVAYSLLPLFLMTTLGADILTVGLIEGGAEVIAAGAKALSGSLSDYWGKRKELAVLGYGLSGFTKPLFALATSPAGVMAVYIGDRLGKGIRVAPRDALVADATPAEQRGAAYGLRQSLDTIGAVLGPLAASVLMATTNQNFQLVFGLTLIPSLLAVGLLIFGVREPAVAGVPKAKQPFSWQALGRLGRGYWWLVAVACLAGLGNSSNAFLLLRSQELGLSTTLVPLTLVVMNVAYFLSAYPAGVLSDRFGRVGLLLSGWLLYSGVYLGFALAPASWLVWGLFAFYGLYLGINKGVLSALIADLIPADLRGTAFGLLNLALGITLFLASLLAGGLWQTVGSATAFIAGSGLTGIAALMLLMGNLLSFLVKPDAAPTAQSQVVPEPVTVAPEPVAIAPEPVAITPAPTATTPAPVANPTPQAPDAA